MKYPQLVPMPSAVSDWLEEQLEARGIDAVVYTRYILSLLHSDTVDVIYSDEDLQFSHLKKEVRRSSGSRKRFRRSSDWWRHAQADAEKLKRSAAVECLMSASEQNCGIESLIDELCKKLDDIKSDSSVDPPVKKANHPELQQVSPQESAKRYYAAFPPLNRNTSLSSPAKLSSLIPKWIPSPKKKVINNNNNITHRRQNNRSYEDAMKASRTVGKQRFGAYFNGRKKEVGIGRPSESMNSDWYSLKKSRVENIPKKDEPNPEWNVDEDTNMYDDLPVDIKELLNDSPLPQEDNVEMMNLANMRETAGTKRYIPFGATRSIWTNKPASEEGPVYPFYNKLNNSSDSILDIQFSSITINNNTTEWMQLPENFLKDHDTNDYLEDQKKWNLSFNGGKWSDDSGCYFEDEQVVAQLSLMKINHDKETSAFAEVTPKSRPQFNPFSKMIYSGLQRETSFKTKEVDKNKDDLLTSVESHFRPINEKLEKYFNGEYADGATFIISNNWEKINYRRTESGAMYMENDYYMRKKYCEYKALPPSVDFALKFLVCQNDKSCQTDEVDAELEALDRRWREKHPRKNNNVQAAPLTCTCRTLATNTECSVGDDGNDCLLHPARSDSTIKTDVLWKQEANVGEKCNNNTPVWNSNGLHSFSFDLQWNLPDESNLRDIWSGKKMCNTCLERPASTLQQHKELREDVSQDGDQLLSDLSTIQKCYMEEGLPTTEFSCDIAEMLMPKERKRRHSLMAAQADEPWSFASRLEEDCLIQMSTIPTLRSVTL